MAAAGSQHWRRKLWLLPPVALAVLAAGWYWLPRRDRNDPFDRAQRAYEQGQWLVALNEAQAAFQRRPPTRDELLFLARCLAQLNYWRDAEAYFQRERDLSRLSREDLELRGRGLLALHWWPQAVAVYGELHRRHPRDGATLQRLAVLQLQVGQAEQALESSQRLTKFADRAAAAHCIQGAIYESLERGEPAVAAFEQALEIDPTGETLPVPRGQVVEKLVRNLIALGRLGQARDWLEGEIAAGPTAPLLCKLADVLHSQSDLDGARERYLQALYLDKSSQPAWLGLGSLALEQHQPAEAIGWLKQAVEIGPENSTMHYQLAQAYLRTGRPDMAAGHQEATQRLREREEQTARDQRAILKYADTPQAKLLIARQALAAGDWLQAESYLTELSRQFPNDGQIQELMTQVRTMQRNATRGSESAKPEQ